MRRRSNLDFERRRRSRRSSYRRRQAKKKLLGKLPKEKKKIHLNLEKIVSGISWVFKIAVTLPDRICRSMVLGTTGEYRGRFYETGT